MTPGRLLYLAKRDLQRGWKAAWGDHVLSKDILKLPPKDNFQKESEVALHILTGQETWLLTMWMLRSWEEQTQTRCPIYLHDDGTLNQAIAQQFTTAFPQIEIIFAEQADSRMEEALSQYPHCAAYRAAHPLAKKCFDVPVYSADSGSTRFILLDSDLLFFKEPSEILKWIESDDGGSWFNQDLQEPSPISSQQAQEQYGHSLWSKVNSGLCLLQKKSCDLEKFESYLQYDALRDAKKWRIEQTLLALGASSLNKGGLLPSSYEVSLNKERQDDCVARHYIGAVRDLFYGEGIRSLHKKLCLNK